MSSHTHGDAFPRYVNLLMFIFTEKSDSVAEILPSSHADVFHHDFLPLSLPFQPAHMQIALAESHEDNSGQSSITYLYRWVASSPSLRKSFYSSSAETTKASSSNPVTSISQPITRTPIRVARSALRPSLRYLAFHRLSRTIRRRPRSATRAGKLDTRVRRTSYGTQRHISASGAARSDCCSQTRRGGKELASG